MITFEYVRWKNFLSTGNAFTEINLTKNRSTLIIGENGAGKSTILDALSFGLYGKPFRKVNKSQLLNSINGKGLEIEIEFTIGKRKYKVRRGMKPNVFEIFQDDKLINQDSASSEYQDMFEKNILKLNHKSFCQIVVLGSASFVPFMQLPSGHRREVIEDLLDIQIFSTMNNILKEKITENKSKLADVDYNIRMTGEKIEMHKKHLEALKQNNDEVAKQKQDKIESLKGDIVKTSALISAHNKEVDKLQKSISDKDKVKNKLEKIGDLKRQLSLKLERLQNEIEFFTDHDNCPTCKQGIDHVHKKDIVSNDNSQIVEVNNAIEKLNTDIDSYMIRIEEVQSTIEKISVFNKDVSNYNVQITTWSKFVDDLKAEIEELHKQEKAPEDNSELQVYKQDLKAFIADKEELVKYKQILDIAANLLRDSGIKTKIIKQYIPIMNKLVNKYLASMDFFVNFELNENFEETIKSRHRDDFSYESFSEGEKMRIDLALLFTWRAIAKLRNSASTNLLIMDEVFDSSLDANGTDEFLKILGTLINDTNVFIISHKGDTLFDKFEHIIRFTKHKNFSRIAS